MMENKLGMVGVGRIINGVIMFTDATGKGFAKSVSRPITPVKETIKEEVVVTVKKNEERLDVPSFMKNRVKGTPKSNVIQFPNAMKAPAKRTLRKDIGRLINYLFDLKEEL